MKAKVAFTRIVGGREGRVEVEVQGETMEGLRAEIDRAMNMRTAVTPGLPLVEDKPGVPDSPQEAEPRETEEASYMEIERVKAQPGGTAIVTVLGGTPVDIDGWWMTFSFNESVRLTRVELGDFFIEHTKKDGKRHDFFDHVPHRGTGPRDPGFVKISYQFLKFSAKSGVEGFEKSIRIPQDTPLVKLHFKLDQDSKGTHIVRHGSGKIANRRTMYTTEKRAQPIYPFVEHGGISI